MRALTQAGRIAARTLTHAWILLKADASAAFDLGRLNTDGPGTQNEAYPPAEARRLTERFELQSVGP